MNSFFKVILSLFTRLYKMSNGKIMGKIAGLNILLLTTTGRKSGKQRTTPLGYFEHDGGYVITASNAGSDKNPGWFLNLTDRPQVQIQIKDKEMPATAQIVSPELRNELWKKLVSLSPQYGGYATSTKRVIPMVLLIPQHP
jgi:deazaflavin-dependent oxidoreductase (nitroreductase family)